MSIDTPTHKLAALDFFKSYEISAYIGFLNIGERWYAKRFLHPDIVAPYEYIFMWDEDLGVEHFDAEE